MMGYWRGLGFSPLVGRRLAYLIAWVYTGMRSRWIEVYEHLPENYHVYELPPGDYWYVLASYDRAGDFLPALRSSRLILISKRTGRVCCNCCAMDEG